MTPTRRSTDEQSEIRGAFLWRHIGPRPDHLAPMLKSVGVASIDAMMAKIVPDNIAFSGALTTPHVDSEQGALRQLAQWAGQNELRTNFIGMGYAGTRTPAVILRNVFENPGWYTQYTPYQSEIAQGRLEALLNYQTMVSDLCGLPIANASMLDEPTAAAEAMTMVRRANGKNKSPRFLVADKCHPQTIEVVKTRAEPLGIEVVVTAPEAFDFASGAFGCLVQYPATDGSITDLSTISAAAAEHGAKVCVATDLLALTLLKAPGHVGADVCVGSAQRFGVPLGYGGPHAAFFACKDEYKRQMPGRIVGVSKDAQGHVAFRLALQTREQHIRREKATSNICTAQVLLAIMSGMYAVYHGREGLLHIAHAVRARAYDVKQRLEALGLLVGDAPLFDTLHVRFPDAAAAKRALTALDTARINVRRPELFAPFDETQIGVTIDETTSDEDVHTLLKALGETTSPTTSAATPALPEGLRRDSDFCTHENFRHYRSETEMLRYVHRLQSRDLSLTTSMIPLGSCTMKLNATSEMIPVSYPGFAQLHPFVPLEQAKGYAALTDSLAAMIQNTTGLDAVSFQPNAGSQGEYAGLLAIRGYLHERGEHQRDICLIPASAHGTNPASATLAGLRVVVVKSDDHGNVDLADLDAKLDAHGPQVACIMVTYPSTHGVFERGIRALCEKVHAVGARVYLDGANLNAQVGHCRPGDYGADVIHLNLHKTFCIPHGGGGPGMGPIAVKEDLARFLPGAPVVGAEAKVGPIAAARHSSASILPISWAYIAMLGPRGLRRATEMAILNANYMRARLHEAYEVLFTGENGFVAHEFILNAKPFEAAGVKVEDIAKRLIDYGFHAPTMSWPVPGTLMIEPTESESKGELDRFCDAMLAIRSEIAKIEDGTWPKDDNPLKNAPHTASVVTDDTWSHPYTRQEAAYPISYIKQRGKFWPHVGRVDNVYGDRNVVCTCPPLSAYEA